MSQPKKPSCSQAIVCLIGIISLIFGGLFYFKASLHTLMMLSICWVICHAYYIDSGMQRIKQSLATTLQNSACMLLFFLLIGAMIAGFIMSGAIPTLLYYGLTFITPQTFLPIGMLLCSMMSLAIGSCWGTIGTIGVALMGVALLLHIPEPIVAGMIVSGAYLGDKFSPVSDTTMLSALATETNLYRHIRGMTYSMLPAYVISLGIFWWLGYFYGFKTNLALTEIQALKENINNHFTIHYMTITPMLAMLWFSIRKKPAELAMLLSVFIAICVAIVIQKFSISAVLESLFCGPKLTKTGSTILDNVLNHGGMQKMLWSMSLTMLILVLGSLLDNYKIISTLFLYLLPYLTRTFSLVFATVFSAITCNVLMGEAYLSIILTARIFKQKYSYLGLNSCALSKAIEVGSTLSTPLIPWTSSGVFITATLGISPQKYLQWALFNWIALGMFLAMAGTNFMGIHLYFKHIDMKNEK